HGGAGSVEASCVRVCCRFFFQAEDGIRAFHVTGVQTCALPICRRPRSYGWVRRGFPQRRGCSRPARRRARSAPVGPPLPRRGGRSEERRVGKEGRPRRPPEDEGKKPERGSNVARLAGLSEASAR